MAESEGNVLNQLPPKNFPNRAREDWDEFAVLAQDHPGQPVLADKHIRRTLSESIKTYRRAPFYTERGHIRVNLRNSQIEDDGLRYGEMYFTWVEREHHEPAND